MLRSIKALEGYVLAALPDIYNDNGEILVLICRHNEDGAMGFVLNHGLKGISLTDLVEQLADGAEEELPSEALRDPPIFWGGPQELSRGFVLHSLDVQYEQTIVIHEKYGVTANLEILRALMLGEEKPEKALIFLGHMLWKAGQLEKELLKKWMIVPPSSSLLFDVKAEDRWNFALDIGGIDHLRCAPTISLG